MSLPIPQKSEDFIGDQRSFKKNVQELKKAIRSQDKVLLHGPPGVGKTMLVYVIAKEEGLTVVETNASDERRQEEMNDIFLQCQQEGMFGEKVLFLLDEVDGIRAWVILEKIISSSLHPIVLTCNEEWKIPKRVKDFCTRIQIREPQVADVLKYIRKIIKDRQNIDFSGVSKDVRSSLISVMYGGEKYKTKDVFGSIEEFFKQGYTDQLRKESIPFLIDNAPQNYYGTDLYMFYHILEIASRTSLSLLSILPRGRGSRVNYPYYLKRMKILRGRKND